MASVASAAAESGDELVVSGGRRGFWRAVTANRKVTLGLIVVVFFTLLAIFGPFFVGSDVNAFGLDRSAPPSGAHLLGTTAYGQDVLAQVVVGARASVALGFSTGVIATIIAVIVGLVSGMSAAGWTRSSRSSPTFSWCFPPCRWPSCWPRSFPIRVH